MSGIEISENTPKRRSQNGALDLTLIADKGSGDVEGYRDRLDFPW